MLKIKVKNGDEGVKESTLYQMELPCAENYRNNPTTKGMNNCRIDKSNGL